LAHEDITCACIYLDALATPAPAGTSPKEVGFATCPSPHLRVPSPLRYCTGVWGGAGGSLTSFVLSPEVLREVGTYVVDIHFHAMSALLSTDLTAVIY
jgi:hypothetical protein